jgi:UDP-N-acetylmuramyl pentapeptide synthase
MARHSLADGVHLIDDTYNANPASMCAALEALARLKGPGRAVAVLGDMNELGESAAEAHRDIGRFAAELGIDFVFALGARAESLAAGAVAAGMNPTHVAADCKHAEVYTRVRDLLRPGDWVLVKGSRAMKMERVIEALCAQESR